MLKNDTVVIFGCDNNYAAYLGGGGISSLIQNSTPNNNYLIYIIEDGISENNKHKIKLMEKENIKINFVQINQILKTVDKKLFHLSGHLTLASYYRFFIPKLFLNFKRVIYADSDIVFLDDVSKLFNCDLRGNYIGAVYDFEVLRQIYLKKREALYYKQTLKLINPKNYFNAGLLVMDLDCLRDFNFTDKCIQKLNEIKNPKFHDQCIINSVLENKVEYINPTWNVQNYMLRHYDILETIPDFVFEECKNMVLNADYKAIHYTGGLKPWDNPFIQNSKFFFEYLKYSPFYDEIINKECIKNPKKTKDRFYKNFLELVFSVKKLKTPLKTYKIITLFGIKIKTTTERRKYPCLKTTNSFISDKMFTM